MQVLSSQIPAVSDTFQHLTPPVVVVVLQAAEVKPIYAPQVVYESTQLDPSYLQVPLCAGQLT